MIKSTVYLPDDLKRLLEQESRRRETSESELIREALRALVSRPAPRPALFHGDDEVADRADELLSGFGER